MADIYRAVKQPGKYLPLFTDTKVNNCLGELSICQNWPARLSVSINLYLYSLLLKNKITTKKILKVIIGVLSAWNNHRG